MGLALALDGDPVSTKRLIPAQLVAPLLDELHYLWCLRGQKNDGSQQWRQLSSWLRVERPEVTTVVSYSDPSVGHTGALYKACNWQWAPTWHRLRPPPSGNGTWAGKQQSVKDRWVFCLLPDASRASLLAIHDESITRKGVIGFVERVK